ncbi:MAG: hypothetical protein EBE86_011225 [Hormoscilla sp. GUM202]|nr:hypothetical protein [Hormoscilla sp. GUM202]
MVRPAASSPETLSTYGQHFKITPDREAQLDWLCKEIGAVNIEEVIERSINVMVALKRQMSPGSQLFLHSPSGQMRLAIPELEPISTEQWQYLVERQHPWRGRGRARNHFPTLPFGTGLAPFNASGYWVIGPFLGQLVRIAPGLPYNLFVYPYPGCVLPGSYNLTSLGSWSP